MNKTSILSRSAVVALGALIVSPAHAAWTLNMNEGVTDLTREVFGLHMLVFWICVVIGIGVFGAMLYSVIVHRKSCGFEASHFHESTAVEIAWTVVPFLILIAVAIPAAGTLLQIEDSSNPDMTIRVTGHQWLWEYDYVDTDVHFYSRLDRDSDKARQMNSGVDPSTVEHYLRNVDNPMVVPVGQKVRLLLTASDVIHSWWVPELGGKKDAIPGYINDMWFKANEPGTYRGQCAELCGRGHAFMPIVVKAVPQDEYEQWVAQQGGDPEGGDDELATGQPSSEEADADAQTATDNSPTAGNATEGRTDDGSELDPQAAEESEVGGGEADTGDEPTSEDPQAGTAGSGDESGAADGSESDDAPQDSGASSDGEQNSDDGNASGSDAGSDSSALSMDELMSQGEQIYGNLCVACHQPDGSGMPAAGFPAIAGGAITTGPVETHISQILNGKGAMPPYKGSLDDTQIAAVVTYERNAFGNDTGDVIQPAQVAEQR